MKNKNLIFGIIIILVVVLGGIGIGYIFFENKENNIDNETLKLLDKYVQSIESACTSESTYTKLFNDDLVKISDLSAEIQLELITNYFEKEFKIDENITFYEQQWPDESGNIGGFYLNESNIECVKKDSSIYDTPCFYEATEPLYKLSDLKNLFNNFFNESSKYYANIIDTQNFPEMYRLKDDNDYFTIIYRGGCGPETFIELNYSHYEETKSEIILYYDFAYGYYSGKYYTGSMDNLILLEDNIAVDDMDLMYDKYKDKLTEFKFTFVKDKENYYYYSIEKA